MERGGSTYIITNRHNSVIYTGSAVDLISRIQEHRLKENPQSFSARYNCYKLVYYQNFSRIEEAREHERYIKGKSRQFKIKLIREFNPDWNDLFDQLGESYFK